MTSTVDRTVQGAAALERAVHQAASRFALFIVAIDVPSSSERVRQVLKGAVRPRSVVTVDFSRRIRGSDVRLDMLDMVLRKAKVPDLGAVLLKGLDPWLTLSHESTGDASGWEVTDRGIALRRLQPLGIGRERLSQEIQRPICLLVLRAQLASLMRTVPDLTSWQQGYFSIETSISDLASEVVRFEAGRPGLLGACRPSCHWRNRRRRLAARSLLRDLDVIGLDPRLRETAEKLGIRVERAMAREALHPVLAWIQKKRARLGEFIHMIRDTSFGYRWTRVGGRNSSRLARAAVSSRRRLWSDLWSSRPEFDILYAALKGAERRVPVVLGEKGAGKSSFVRAVCARLVEDSAGEVAIVRWGLWHDPQLAIRAIARQGGIDVPTGASLDKVIRQLHDSGPIALVCDDAHDLLADTDGELYRDIEGLARAAQFRTLPNLVVVFVLPIDAANLLYPLEAFHPTIGSVSNRIIVTPPGPQEASVFIAELGLMNAHALRAWSDNTMSAGSQTSLAVLASVVGASPRSSLREGIVNHRAPLATDLPGRYLDDLASGHFGAPHKVRTFLGLLADAPFVTLSDLRRRSGLADGETAALMRRLVRDSLVERLDVDGPNRLLKNRSRRRGHRRRGIYRPYSRSIRERFARFGYLPQLERSRRDVASAVRDDSRLGTIPALRAFTMGLLAREERLEAWRRAGSKEAGIVWRSLGRVAMWGVFALVMILLPLVALMAFARTVNVEVDYADRVTVRAGLPLLQGWEVLDTGVRRSHLKRGSAEAIHGRSLPLSESFAGDWFLDSISDGRQAALSCWVRSSAQDCIDWVLRRPERDPVTIAAIANLLVADQSATKVVGQLIDEWVAAPVASPAGARARDNAEALIAQLSRQHPTLLAPFAADLLGLARMGRLGNELVEGLLVGADRMGASREHLSQLAKSWSRAPGIPRVFVPIMTRALQKVGKGACDVPTWDLILAPLETPGLPLSPFDLDAFGACIEVQRNRGRRAALALTYGLRRRGLNDLPLVYQGTRLVRVLSPAAAANLDELMASACLAPGMGIRRWRRETLAICAETRASQSWQRAFQRQLQVLLRTPASADLDIFALAVYVAPNLVKELSPRALSRAVKILQEVPGTPAAQRALLSLGGGGGGDPSIHRGVCSRAEAMNLLPGETMIRYCGADAEGFTRMVATMSPSGLTAGERLLLAQSRATGAEIRLKVTGAVYSEAWANWSGEWALALIEARPETASEILARFETFVGLDQFDRAEPASQEAWLKAAAIAASSHPGSVSASLRRVHSRDSNVRQSGLRELAGAVAGRLSQAELGEGTPLQRLGSALRGLGCDPRRSGECRRAGAVGLALSIQRGTGGADFGPLLQQLGRDLHRGSIDERLLAAESALEVVELRTTTVMRVMPAPNVLANAGIAVAN